jgi:CRISPR-associated exonuclease Cas4
VAWLPLVALLLAGLGFWLLIRAGAARRETGLPLGRVTYVDTGTWNRCERPLFSQRYGVTGRPDYLVQSGQHVIPVEVKSGTAPDQPYKGHLLQLAAYCLLVEEQESRTPPYGIVKYDDQAFEVDYTPALRAELLDSLEAIRRHLHARDVDRNHDDVARCLGCGYRERCAQRLS